MSDIEAWVAAAQEQGRMVSVYDEHGVCLQVSGRAQELLGLPPERLEGRAGYGLLHPDHVPHVAAVHEQMLQDQRPRRFTYQLRSGSGAYRWVESDVRVARVDGAMSLVLVTRLADELATGAEPTCKTL